MWCRYLFDALDNPVLRVKGQLLDSRDEVLFGRALDGAAQEEEEQEAELLQRKLGRGRSAERDAVGHCDNNLAQLSLELYDTSDMPYQLWNKMINV